MNVASNPRRYREDHLSRQKIAAAVRQNPSKYDVPEAVGLPEKWDQDFPWGPVTSGLLTEWQQLMMKIDSYGGVSMRGGLAIEEEASTEQSGFRGRDEGAEQPESTPFQILREALFRREQR